MIDDDHIHRGAFSGLSGFEANFLLDKGLEED
jgi:hypothetical protein